MKAKNIKLILCILVIFHSSFSTASAECGVVASGSCLLCDAMCYKACQTMGLPECTGPSGGWSNCCYSGMMNSCDPVALTCDCDFIPAPVPILSVCVGPGDTIPPYQICGGSPVQACCATEAECHAIFPPTSTPAPTPTPVATATPAPFTPYSPPTNETFDAVNPLNIGGGTSIDQSSPSAYKTDLSTPGGIISRALTFIFPLAGLLLFALLVWGGFEMLIGSPTKKSMESGKNRITAAVAGFFLLFAAYWIWQIVEVIFGVAIL